MKSLQLVLTGLVYRDGGTCEVYCPKTDEYYYIDMRIRTETKGSLYDRYPGDAEAKIINCDYTLHTTV